MRDTGNRHERDVFVDALRVGSVLVVVAAHWATTTVVWEQGRIEGENALSVIAESHPATWLLQVMPLLFFVGGYANALSLARHDGYVAYVRTRLARLLTPTVAFMAVWLLVAVVAQALPLPEPNVVERAADLAALPFWFLGLYVLVVALAPTMWWLHERLGWGVPLLLAVGAATVDTVVHGFGYEGVGVLNYGFVWLLPHQLGFFYADGRLAGMARRNAGALAVAGLACLLVAVTIGGYPVSMVGVPGEERWNTDPPSLALVAMTMWLLGLALLLRPLVGSWGARARRLLDRLRAVVLTLYLWHVSAVALAAAVVYPLGFPRSETGSSLWWATRPLWLLVLAPCLALLTFGFRRLEVHPAPQPVVRTNSPAVRLVVAALAIVSCALGLIGFGVSGFDRVAAEQGEGILAFTVNPLQNTLHVVVGLALLRAVVVPVAPAIAGTAAAMLYLVLGAAGWSAGVGLLAANAATARLHAVVGSLGVLLLALAAAIDRWRLVRQPDTETRRARNASSHGRDR